MIQVVVSKDNFLDLVIFNIKSFYKRIWLIDENLRLMAMKWYTTYPRPPDQI